jgi:pyridoxal phosphate enzyme (YggS family)
MVSGKRKLPFPFDFGGLLEYITYLILRMIAENLEILRKRICDASIRSGRGADDVGLVAVSKTFSQESIKEAVNAGQLDFGENYVQELREKVEGIGNPELRWHYIGHLQSNKVKYIAGYIHLIHSVDNLSLGREIDNRAGRFNRVQDVLVEVHTTDEKSKFGAGPGKVVELIKELSLLPNLRVRGLMTMGPFSDDPGDSRPSFRLLMELKKRIESEGIANTEMRYMSMGMSHDFEVAIEEGANLVRIGTAIFGGRIKK